MQRLGVWITPQKVTHVNLLAVFCSNTLPTEHTTWPLWVTPGGLYPKIIIIKKNRVDF